jgi:hypothetical protein
MEHVGVLVGETTKIMGIKITNKFLINRTCGLVVDGGSTYKTIISRTWDKQMKTTISLEKYRIKMKEDDNNIILPLDPTMGKMWMNPIDETLKIIQ